MCQKVIKGKHVLTIILIGNQTFYHIFWSVLIDQGAILIRERPNTGIWFRLEIRAVVGKEFIVPGSCRRQFFIDRSLRAKLNLFRAGRGILRHLLLAGIHLNNDLIPYLELINGDIRQFVGFVIHKNQPILLCRLCTVQGTALAEYTGSFIAVLNIKDHLPGINLYNLCIQSET